MNLYIELLAIGSILLVFFLWAIWKNLTDFIYAWRYKPENDKTRRREEIGRGKPESESPSDSISGVSSLEGRELLQTAELNSVGEDSSSNREPSSIIRRLRKRKEKIE